MIKVLLFKLKNWYGNALKSYTDSQVQEMPDSFYDKPSDTYMLAVYPNKKESGQGKEKRTPKIKKRS